MILLSGLPASGKSTFDATKIPAGYRRISLDVLKTRAREARVLAEAIARRENFVVDNTNVTLAERQRFIAPAKAAGYEVVGYFFQSVIKDSLVRNAQRTGKARIPDIGVVSRAKELVALSRDEGFDQLYFVQIADGDFTITDWCPTP